MPILLVDTEGTLIYYNEPAEVILDQRFDETGEMAGDEWAQRFALADEERKPIAPEDRPMMMAITERQARFAHGVDAMRQRRMAPRAHHRLAAHRRGRAVPRRDDDLLGGLRCRSRSGARAARSRHPSPRRPATAATRRASRSRGAKERCSCWTRAPASAASRATIARTRAARRHPAHPPAHGPHPGPRILRAALPSRHRGAHLGSGQRHVRACDARLMRYLSPPLFPVSLSDCCTSIVFHEVPCGEFDIGEFRICTALVCHPGPTVGYRIAGPRKRVLDLPAGPRAGAGRAALSRRCRAPGPRAARSPRTRTC